MRYYTTDPIIFPHHLGTDTCPDLESYVIELRAQDGIWQARHIWQDFDGTRRADEWIKSFVHTPEELKTKGWREIDAPADVGEEV